ncbi:hypothetical protein BDF20DRAFT_270494 [Mycotypha africana]|uniref:uncharacterized protein n=1 Tax=Mycotypha africana TaxID=64632 RepID=UPI0022FFD762|nr:uncharacterized protein BDF20DRAFT_270494 [Mycotypha africana]KAI8987507.1 hypothetical protein BDF20DRAFT_270494 [Mycotypha africana]
MELPQIGKHCQFDSCQVLDFLPVACPFCEQIFCGNHRLPINHRCSQWKCVDKQLIQCDVCSQLVTTDNSSNRNGSEIASSDIRQLSSEEALKKHKLSGCRLLLYKTTMNNKNSRSCAVDKCQDIDPHVGPVQCDGCDRNFCLRHRHPASHACPSLKNREDRKLQRNLAAQEKLANTFVPNTVSGRKTTTPGSVSQKINSTTTKKKSSSMVELMKIKAQAKGNPSIPPALRIYLYVQYPEETQLKEAPMYFDKKNTIGKTLDQIADFCNLINKNNLLSSTDSMRLELYKCCPESVLLQDKSQTLENALQNLETICLERLGKAA